MGKNNKGYNTHHTIPKSRENEGYDVSHPRNLQSIKTSTHNAIHALFSNQTPREQLETWININKRVLNHDTIRALYAILDAKNFYHRDVLK